MSVPIANVHNDLIALPPLSPSESLPIQQVTVLSKLPSELTLEIFSYVDIVSLFRFLDSCRYHRFLLLNLPEIWRRIRFMPISEYTTLAAANHNTPPGLFLSATAAASATGNTQPPAHSAPSKQQLINRRLKHAENERDRDRGGSESLTSEIYAVLRRFRRSNRLVDFVREVYMDGTDSMHFPSPLVMLVKFPGLQVLSSRYRRNQTSIERETGLLKDMLRNGTFPEHGLMLRKWDIFHPYMTKDDGATAFRNILNLLSAVGNSNEDGTPGLGVSIDIKRCPGPEDGAGVPWATNGSMHFATAAHHPASTPLVTTATAADAHNANLSTNPGDNSLAAITSVPPKICTNIVWTREKCRVCDAPQDRCWQCKPICATCRAARAPPNINHQTAMERERQRTASKSLASKVSSLSLQLPVRSTTEILSPRPMHLHINGVSLPAELGDVGSSVARPITPPGSISLSQMSNPSVTIPSAHSYLLPTPDASPVPAWQASLGCAFFRRLPLALALAFDSAAFAASAKEVPMKAPAPALVPAPDPDPDCDDAVEDEAVRLRDGGGSVSVNLLCTKN
ncbi:hypothetical protein BG004_003659, partial [Podila humilis]